MIDVLKLYDDIETLKNDISKALKKLDGKTPNLHSMRALVACHDLLPYLSALIALQYGNKEDEVHYETGTDRDLGKYDKEVMNDEGYYDEDGNFHWYASERE